VMVVNQSATEACTGVSLSRALRCVFILVLLFSDATFSMS
jgi:hypothetical protein